MKRTNITHTGQYGIVLFPDRGIKHRAIKIAEAHHKGNSIKFEEPHTPHVTLYHSKLENVPSTVVEKYLTHLIGMLPLTLTFIQLNDFGGKFLFWDIHRTQKLVRAHKYALGLSKYFVPAGKQQADKENLILPRAEKMNVKKFGHPLVNNLWRPHVTIGYYPHGVQQSPTNVIFYGHVSGVAFVRVGKAGTIAEVIATHFA